MIRRFLLLMGLVLVLGGTGILAARSLSAAALASGSGTIYSVDLKHKQVNVRQSNGSHLRLRVNSASVLTRNGSRVQLKGLSLRDTTTVKFDPATQMIAQLAAAGPQVTTASGRVKGVSRSTGMIKVGQKLFQTNGSTRIARNGHLAALGSLTRRDSLVVHFSAGTNLALDVVDEGPEESEVEGTITGIVGSAVTITPENGTPPVTVTADANTMVEVNDQSATLADLLVGMKADAEYDPTTLVAFSIEAEIEANASVTGVVASTTATTITINPNGGGAPITLNVDAFTEIEVNGESATLADVLAGMPVTAEYDTTTMTATQIQAGSGSPGEGSDEAEVEGTVQAVSATSITIAPSDGGSPVTLAVDGSTEIEVNGEDGTIQQIVTGDSVQAEYDPTTLLATQIEVGGDGGDSLHK